MYKVFFNDRKITITSEANITINKSSEIIENISTKEDVKKWFLQFSNDDKHAVTIIHPNAERFWEDAFLPAFKFIRAAGGVVFKKGKMLVIFRNERWDLPKGKIDKNESIEAAAIREVQEECGINGHSIIRKLPSTFHIYLSNYKDSSGQWILKETFWFEMKYSGIENGIPQTEENITQIRWFSKNELGQVLSNTYENLKPVFLFYFD